MPVSLASITIPSSATNIGDRAFYNCYSLASITIPSSVTNIGERAFLACRSLASITIPNSVQSISDRAFSNCYGVAHYYVYPTTPPALGGGSVFYNIPSDCTIHVPAVALDDYKAAQYWVNLAHRW